MTHASHMTLSPFGPGTAPCTGLTEIPFLETAKERAFAFSSGECDVMSLVSGQVGEGPAMLGSEQCHRAGCCWESTRRHFPGGSYPGRREGC